MGRRRKDASGDEASDVGVPKPVPADKTSPERNLNSHLAFLIDSVTTSPANELDVGLLKQIKQLVRLSDANVHAALNLLMEKLKKNHAQVRYLALLVVDELFTRSKLFRTLLVDNFEAFMLHSIGFRSEYPLPPPANRATLLRAKGMEMLEKWNDLFGPHYKPLRLGYEYLKNTLNLQFPNLRQAAAQAEQQREEREARSIALIQKKYDSLKEDFPVLSGEIQSTLNQLDQCFEILFNGNKQGYTAQTGGTGIGASKVEVDGYSVNSLRHILDQAGSQQAGLCETQDNKPIFDTLRDLSRLVVSQHIPVTQDWMSILMRVVTQDRETHNSLLRRVIDIRNHLSIAKSKCIEMGIDVQISQVDEEANGVDEIIWEVGVVDGAISKQEGVIHEQLSVEPEISVTKGHKQPVLPSKAVKLDGKELLGRQQNDCNRQLLLKDAPVMPWGSYLDRWGAEHTVPVNQKGLLLENHWGRVDYDALLPAEKVTEMNMRASYYQSTPSEIPPCQAPLRNGRLCQRRDLRVCPLHGPVIPRDCQGNPIPKVSDVDPIIKVSENSSLPSQSVIQDCQVSDVDPIIKVSENSSLPSQSVIQDSNACKFNSAMTKDDVMKALAAKAVANVRSMEDTESSKKRGRRLQIKRDNEHNATVLRGAALAGTSQGFGEILGEDLERFDDRSTGLLQERKRAKASLKAMLQPKPTAKDRLAERLLSSQVMDSSTRQLTREEDAAYRDAFTNQW